jgi:hypothetical protein
MSGMVEEFHEGETAGAREEREHFERVVGSFIGYEEVRPPQRAPRGRGAKRDYTGTQVALAEEKRARNAAKRLSPDLERRPPAPGLGRRKSAQRETAPPGRPFARGEDGRR